MIVRTEIGTETEIETGTETEIGMAEEITETIETDDLHLQKTGAMALFREFLLDLVLTERKHQPQEPLLHLPHRCLHHPYPQVLPTTEQRIHHS